MVEFPSVQIRIQLIMAYPSLGFLLPIYGFCLFLLYQTAVFGFSFLLFFFLLTESSQAAILPLHMPSKRFSYYFYDTETAST